MNKLQHWVTDIFADPVTKRPCKQEDYTTVQGVIDARVFLRNTHGYSDWAEGQLFYEEEISGKDANTVEDYQIQMDYNRPIYQHFQMAGRILDCGGGGHCAAISSR